MSTIYSTPTDAVSSIIEAICASGDVTPQQAELVANHMRGKWVHTWRHIDANGVQHGNSVYYIAPEKIHADTYSSLVNMLWFNEIEIVDAFWSEVAGLLEYTKDVPA